MDDPRFPKILYFLLLAAGLYDWITSYPQLPETMASHFRFDGTANNWQPKESFFLVMSGVVALSFVLTFLVPRLLASQPASRLNLPNKDYWLALGRREETFRFFSAQMGWSGCAILFILLYATSEAIQVNLHSGRHFNNHAMLKVLGGFLLFMAFWTVHFLRHFYRLPPGAALPPS